MALFIPIRHSRSGKVQVLRHSAVMLIARPVLLPVPDRVARFMTFKECSGTVKIFRGKKEPGTAVADLLMQTSSYACGTAIQLGRLAGVPLGMRVHMVRLTTDTV